MHGRNLRRVDQSSQYPPTRAELDEGGQVQEFTPRGASKRNVGKIGGISRRVQRVRNRVFTGRIISGTAVGSEYRHTGYCTLVPYTVVHCGMTRISCPPSIGNGSKDTHHKVPHRDDLAFAEGRLVLVEPERKMTPSNVPVLRVPFLVDLTAPPPLLLDLPCPATFSSACSLLAISWYSSIVFSTAHAQHE